LKALFPQAHIQGKGLVATEGFISLPMGRQGATALAIRSHFFEFLPQNGGKIKRAHELEEGQEYSVVLTTGGGLYRYQMHDLIQVVGYHNTCPNIRFLGKEDHVSDWFGEKINEQHVREVLMRLNRRYAISPSFAMLAPENELSPPAYCLFIQVAGQSDLLLAEIGEKLEESMCENYHYRYCRQLGQLGPMMVFKIAQEAHETYLSRCVRLGQKSGAIKPLALHSREGWSRWFQGSIVHNGRNQKGITSQG